VDFGLSEEQRLLEASVRGALGEQLPMERVRELRDADCPNDSKAWRALAELGVAGVLIPEAQGGAALSLLDAALISQSLGHAASPTPFLSSGVMAAAALGALAAKGGAGAAQARDWLAGIASGAKVFGVAATELFSLREDAGVELRGGALHGKALMALDCCAADCILAPLAAPPGTVAQPPGAGDPGAESAAESPDAADAKLAVVSGAAKGLRVTRLATVDATRCTAELIFEGVAPEAVFEDAGAAIARMLDGGRIALAADALGACESMLEQALAYAGERRQFGRVIGSFQAVKHMCAEMVAELEPARALLWFAAHSFDALPEQTPLMACHALAHISEIGREIASIATQVHGGIGWTDEQNLHFWFKRIGAARHLLGGPELLRERAARLQGFMN